MGFWCKLFLIALVVTPGVAAASAVNVPILLDYRVIDKALKEQLFTGPDGSAKLLDDGFNCNSLTLSEPSVGSAEGGLIRLQTRVSARIGTPVGGNCLFPVTWQGQVQTLQEVFVAPTGLGVGFRVVDSSIINDPGADPAPTAVWELLKSYIHPRLSAVNINLEPTIATIQQLLAGAGKGSQEQLAFLSTLGLSHVSSENGQLNITLKMNAPDAPANWLAASSGALSEQELAQWDSAWQAWDGFATWMIKTMAAPADPALASELGEILLDARYDLYEALSSEDKSRDPVRELFTKTWTRLAPLLRQNKLAIPGGEALEFATFISAADALQILDSAAPQLGLRIDSQTFRSLARLLLPTVQDADLDYDTDVDPELRALMGLDPEFEASAEEESELLLPFVWLVPQAQAGAVDPKLVQKLTGWVPTALELNDYLNTMNRLLEEIIRAEREKGKVPVSFFPVYEDLLLATAWQESCWRQYIHKGGKVQPILSAAGSVGLMQVNKNVWRGIYDPKALDNNVAYNARAGNEILVHYLVDYAIKKKEHQITGNANNLARATYAAYNGGPGHLSRYRNPNNRKSLQEIDSAFWQKYQAIARNGSAAVRACYSN